MRANEFLVEYSRVETLKNYGMKALQHWEKDTKQNFTTKFANQPENLQIWLDHVVERLEQIDPTPHKEYVQWIVRAYGNNPSEKFEDYGSRGADALEKFNTLKIKKILPADKRDINKLRSLNDLETLVSQFTLPDVEVTNKGNAEAYYDDAQIRVIVPLNEQAAKYYGQGTQWCTAARNNNMFDRYNKSGKLYIILPKQPAHVGEKYQFSFAENQYMDETDRPAKLTELVNRFPQLTKIFHEQAVQGLCYALLPNGKEILNDWEHITNEVVQLVMGQIPVTKIVKSVEKEISQDPAMADRIEFRDVMSQFTIDIANTQYDIILHFMNALKPKIQHENEEEEVNIQEELRDWMLNQQFGDMLSTADYDGKMDEMTATYSIIDYMSLYILPLIKQAIRTQIT